MQYLGEYLRTRVLPVALTLVGLGVCIEILLSLTGCPTHFDAARFATQSRVDHPSWAVKRVSLEYDAWNSSKSVWLLLKWRGEEDFYTELTYHSYADEPWRELPNPLVSGLSQAERASFVRTFAARHGSDGPTVATRPSWDAYDNELEVGSVPLEKWNRSYQGSVKTEQASTWDIWRRVGPPDRPTWSVVRDDTAR